MDDKNINTIKINQLSFSNETISQFIHELTQPLMVINTYINGCIYRIQENSINNAQLLDIMSTINQHSSALGHTIHKLNDFLSQSHKYSESGHEK